MDGSGAVNLGQCTSFARLPSLSFPPSQLIPILPFPFILVSGDPKTPNSSPNSWSMGAL